MDRRAQPLRFLLKGYAFGSMSSSPFFPESMVTCCFSCQPLHCLHRQQPCKLLYYMGMFYSLLLTIKYILPVSWQPCSTWVGECSL